MSIAYTLVPKDMVTRMMPTPKNLDDYIVTKAKRSMHTIKKSQKLKPVSKHQRYMAQLRNIIKTKREVASRPTKVTIVNKKARPIMLSTGTMVDEEELRKMGYVKAGTPVTVSTEAGPSRVNTSIIPDADVADENVVVTEHPTKQAWLSDVRQTRKTGPTIKDANNLRELTQKVVEFLNVNPEDFGIVGTKIENDQHRVMPSSDVTKSVEYILNTTYRGPLITNRAPPGTEFLQSRMNASTDFNSSFADMLVPYVQVGKGKRNLTSNRPKKSNELSKKIGSSLHTKVIAAMKKSNRPLMVGRGNKKGGAKRGRPREKPKQNKKKNSSFRVERWRLPKR